MNASQLINQTSGEVEYFTPEPIITAARLAMGSIELDPASCSEANLIVNADRFFTKEEDGLVQPWKAKTVWLNWPFGKKTNGPWSKKLIWEWGDNSFEQACCITYACTSELWFRPLLTHLQCFLHGRTNYRLPDGSFKKGNTKGSVVTYFGTEYDRFYHAFKGLGAIKICYTP